MSERALTREMRGSEIDGSSSRSNFEGASPSCSHSAPMPISSFERSTETEMIIRTCLKKEKKSLRKKPEKENAGCLRA